MVRAGFMAIPRVTHRAALAGVVIDADDRTPLSNVAVEIVSGPPTYAVRLAALRRNRMGAEPERRITDGEGRFRWIDLPPGTYELHVALAGNRYAAATLDVEVLAPGVKPIEIALAPTALTGIVHSAGSPTTPLALARVRLVDSGEVAYTSATGEFRLAPIEPGTDRLLEVSASNHLSKLVKVSPVQGKTTKYSPKITLTRT